MQDYFDQDKEFTKLLANYSQKQLSQPIQQEVDMKELIQATKPLTVEEQQQHSMELERLRSAFLVSEQQYLASMIELEKVSAKVSFAKQYDWNAAQAKSYEQLSIACNKLETELQSCKQQLKQKLVFVLRIFFVKLLT